MKSLPTQAVLGLALALAVLFPRPSLADGLDGPTAILERHNAAFAAGDVDTLLADYAEDAVFIGPMGVLRGRDQRRRAGEARSSVPASIEATDHEARVAERDGAE